MVLPTSSNADLESGVRCGGYSHNCCAASARVRTRRHNHASVGMRHITGGSCAAQSHWKARWTAYPEVEIIALCGAIWLQVCSDTPCAKSLIEIGRASCRERV